MIAPQPIPGVPGYVQCERHGIGGRAPWVCPDCKTQDPSGFRSADSARSRGPGPTRPGGSTFSNARSTVCAAGHKHPSKMEARVCDRLSRECEASGDQLVRNIRLPLLSIAPKDTGTPLYLTVDFGIVRGGRLVRLIDAKSRRVSRDWTRGARACEAAWGVPVEEVDR